MRSKSRVGLLICIFVIAAMVLGPGNGLSQVVRAADVVEEGPIREGVAAVAQARWVDVDHTEAALAVAKAKEPLTQQLEAHRRAVLLRQLCRQQGGKPVTAKQLAHGGAGIGARRQFIVLFGQHASVPSCKDLVSIQCSV